MCQDYEILNVFPFTSETKRMGIIVKDTKTNTITFYMKGADAVMARIVQANDWLEEECGNMAREGLRTLVFGKKDLTEEDYENFSARLTKAKTTIQNRAANVQAVIETLEENLELIGLTGVEDKLQPGVQQTLEMLRNAGLKIWMLTGDKIETATCIAISAGLISKKQVRYTNPKKFLCIDTNGIYLGHSFFCDQREARGLYAIEHLCQQKRLLFDHRR